MANEQDLRKIIQTLSDLENHKLELEFKNNRLVSEIHEKEKRVAQHRERLEALSTQLAAFDTEIESICVDINKLEKEIVQEINHADRIKRNTEVGREQLEVLKAASLELKNRLETELVCRKRKLDENLTAMALKNFE